MSTKCRIQLLSTPGGERGDLGFKMTGAAREGRGLCRVWLRRSEPWERYLDPREERNSKWDVRVSVKRDSAFELRDEYHARNLDDLLEAFEFPTDEDAANALSSNGDPTHDAVVEWTKKVLQSPATSPEETRDAPAPAVSGDA